VSAAAPRSTVYQTIRLVDRPILIVAGRNYDLRIIDHCKSVYSRTHLREKWGRRYGARSLSLRIREVLRKIGADGYTTHGLRKNAGISLAENGATGAADHGGTGPQDAEDGAVLLPAGRLEAAGRSGGGHPRSGLCRPVGRPGGAPPGADQAGEVRREQAEKKWWANKGRNGLGDWNHTIDAFRQHCDMIASVGVVS
jgi:hypothetical protein